MLPNLNETDSPALVPFAADERIGMQSFYEHKTIEQIVRERGLKPARWEDLFPEEPIWESQEDFDRFWNTDPKE